MLGRSAKSSLQLFIIAGTAAWFVPTGGHVLAVPARDVASHAMTNAAEVAPGGKIIVVPGREFTWEDVTSADYTNYLANLRAVGCPEARVRQVVLADVSEYFNQRRLEAAVQWDFEWWKPGTTSRAPIFARTQHLGGLDRYQFLLLARLLGTNVAESIELPSLSNGLSNNLTGPVLGAMPLDRYNAAAQVCNRARERLLEYQMSRFSGGQQADPVEEARLRAETRLELSRIFTPEEMEEFLVRNSHNAEALRQSLRGFDPTPEEFRKIFEALDPIQHQMQRDYGNIEALSARQQEEFERQCDLAVKEVLTPERFQQYEAVKDPIYQRAQIEATQWGLGEAAVPQLRALFRSQQNQRTQILSDTSLTPDQRNRALQDLAKEERLTIQELLKRKTAPPEK